MEKVLSGGNFRDSYRSVGLSLGAVEGEDPVSSLKKRTSIGTTGNPGIGKDRAWHDSMRIWVDDEMSRLSSVYSSLIPGLTEIIL